MLVSVVLLFALLALHWLPRNVDFVVDTLSALVALPAVVVACGGVLVIYRYRRAVHGERDLFLDLNRSRDSTAITAVDSSRPSRIRRWLAQRMLGHDLVVGDLIEVKPWDEIRATLDEQGCLEQLPFMPEMLAMCGQRAHVFRCVHRLFDHRKSRHMRHMDGTVLLIGAVCDGSNHGGCEAACHTVWKAAWLRRVGQGDHGADTARSRATSDAATETAVLQSGIQVPHYTCQLTQLHAASKPVSKWSATNFFRPLIAGNVTTSAFVVAWLTYLFNRVQYRRGGVAFPTFETPARDDNGRQQTPLSAGDHVLVRSSAEIRATLNDRLMHRGLWFEPDMLKHCGGRCCVQAEVRKLIDIVTGEMLTMKTPAYMLRDVHFSGERQLFNAQHEPLFWRGEWLQRTGD